VPPQFFEHPEAIHAVLSGVMEDVNLPEREKKFALDRVTHERSSYAIAQDANAAAVCCC
jgi:hypothetical protein